VYKLKLRRLTGVLIVMFSLSIFMSVGWAANIPKLSKKVHLTVREQPIDVFMQNFFGQLDLPVSVDTAVTGVVNGDFQGSARKVLRDIKRAFGLVTYHDGAVVYVYLANDVTRKIISIAPEIALRVMRSADEMKLPDRSNTLHTTSDGSLVVTGVARFTLLVEELVRSAQNAQAAQPPLGFKVFYLQYAWAQDVTINAAGRKTIIPGVASILRSLFSSSPQTSSRHAVHDSLSISRLQKLRGKGLIGSGNQETLGIFTDEEKINMASNADDISGQVRVNNRKKELPTNGMSEVRIEADPRLNAVIVRDTFERMSHYEKLIESLDVEPQSLEIEATIIDIDTDRMKELGINWRWAGGGNEALFGRGDSTDTRLNADSNSTPIGRGGFISLVLGGSDNFVARINALETEGAASIVSRPQVMTLSNVEATFNVNSTVYVRVAGEREVDLFNISAGTLLRVKPHVFNNNEEDWIKLMVAIEDGNITQQSVDQIPIVENSTINTQALIQAGESLLIGGMVREISEDTVVKVPVLGDIPWLGELFRYEETRVGHIERLFLISPRLAPKMSESIAYADQIINSPKAGFSQKINEENNKKNENKVFKKSQIESANEAFFDFES